MRANYKSASMKRVRLTLSFFSAAKRSDYSTWRFTRLSIWKGGS